jgi:hypothetical protein
VGARLGGFEDGSKEGIILGRKFQRLYFHLGAFRQPGPRRQDDHPILDFSGYAHDYCFTLNLTQKQAAARAGSKSQWRMIPKMAGQNARLFKRARVPPRLLPGPGVPWLAS